MPDVGRFFNIDPLAEDYSYQGPYNFSENRVIDAFELEGLEAIVINDKGSKHVMKQAATPQGRNSATLSAVISHPIAASKVGEFKRGGTNISSVSGRIARHVAEDGNMTVGEGSESNAVRHALWSATMTSEFGSEAATKIGNAHEGVKVRNSVAIDFNQPLVQDLEYADSVVDILNNEIGRSIGENFEEGTSLIDIAMEVLNVYKNEGLWEGSTDKDGNFTIKRNTISQSQLENGARTLRTLDSNGFNNEDRKDLKK